MTRFRSLALATVLILTAALPAWACLWDTDTLEQEKYQFPSVHELLVGHFPRHSPAFYRWRIADRQKRLENEPTNLDLYDDIAVAHDKLGDSQKAIDLMLEKEKLSPGLYTTAANLGTFLIHNGQYEEGLQHIRRAIEINPDAHFGREEYQQYLVEYVVLRDKQHGKRVLPLSTRVSEERLPGESSADYELRKSIESENHYDPFGFAVFLKHRLAQQDRKWSEEEREKAVQGLLGIMRFGNYDSPIVLEALGDVLLAQGETSAARQLAARAYLRARDHWKSTDREAKAPREAYRLLAVASLELQQGAKFAEIYRDLQAEVGEARTWFRELEAEEARWIRTGQDPEAMFRQHYLDRQASLGNHSVWAVAGVASVVVVGLLALVARRRWARA
jgi:tetratricopeptide (TPR) repeat protein